MKPRSTNFRTKIAGVAVAVLVAATAISIGSSSSSARIPAPAYASETLSQRALSLQHTRHFLKLAQSHADICLQNEQQCLQGCDGASSCSSQCETNYQGCMNQGG